MNDKGKRQRIVENCIDKGWLDMHDINKMALPDCALKSVTETMTDLIKRPKDIKIEIRYVKRNNTRVRLFRLQQDPHFEKYSPTDPRRSMSTIVMMALGIRA